MEQALLKAAALAYALSAIVGILQILRPDEKKQKGTLLALALALVVHAIAIASRGLEIDAFPITGIHDGLSTFAFLAGVLALLVAWRGGVPQVAALSTPLLAGLVVISSIVEPQGELPPAVRSAWLVVHIGLALLGDAAFAVAGAVSIVYLVHERRLKQKKRAKVGTALHKLPSLEVLDHVSLRLFQWGFPFMTLGLLSGVLYGREVWGHYWTWDPRNTVSLIVWLLYAIMLYARLLVGWRGRRAAILTLVGVAAILIAFVGLGLAGVGTHGKDYVS